VTLEGTGWIGLWRGEFGWIPQRRMADWAGVCGVATDRGWLCVDGGYPMEKAVCGRPRVMTEGSAQESGVVVVASGM